MSKKIVAALAALALTSMLVPLKVVHADQWHSPYMCCRNSYFNYNYQSSVEGRLWGPINNAQGGWTGIIATNWGGFSSTSNNPSAPGQVREFTSGWPHGSSWVGWTTWSGGANNTVAQATTDLNAQNFDLNTGTTHYCCVNGKTSYSAQDTMVHEFGFVIALNEGCYGAGTIPGSPADTADNSEECDINEAKDHSGPASNDVAAVKWIYPNH